MPPHLVDERIYMLADGNRGCRSKPKQAHSEIRGCSRKLSHSDRTWEGRVRYLRRHQAAIRKHRDSWMQANRRQYDTSGWLDGSTAHLQHQFDWSLIKLAGIFEGNIRGCDEPKHMAYMEFHYRGLQLFWNTS